MNADNSLQTTLTNDKFNKTLLFNNLKWMNSEEASAYLSTSIGSIRNMVYRGQLPAKKLGNRLKFKKNDLDFLIENSDSKRNLK